MQPITDEEQIVSKFHDLPNISSVPYTVMKMRWIKFWSFPMNIDSAQLHFGFKPAVQRTKKQNPYVFGANIVIKRNSEFFLIQMLMF